MKVEEFYQALKKSGVDFASGVPCAAQKRILHHFMTDPEMTYVQVAREEDAIGVAAGACLAGKKPIAIMQNSGLANSINSLASLCIPYEIPVLVLATWRGHPDDRGEVPYHLVTGRSIISMLSDLGIPAHVISSEDPEKAISDSMGDLSEKRIPSVMLLMRRGILE